MSRGMLTDEVKEDSRNMLGYEITQQELRLLPYIQYCIMNNAHIDRKRINRDENIILHAWEERGFIDLRPISSAQIVSITVEFYRAMMEILLVGYCADFILETKRQFVRGKKEKAKC